MNNINYSLNTAIVFCMFVLLTACAPDDKKVEDNIIAGIFVLDSNIRVNVKDGVVTLSGTVMDESTRNAAESTVKEIKGVKSVINNTTVREQLTGDAPIVK